MDLGRLKRRAPTLTLAATLAAHVAVALSFAPPSVVLGPRPLTGIDYELHYGQVATVADAFRQFGQSWAYDPQRLAGQLTGVLFDADNKAWEAWVLLLGVFGVPTHLAFNVFLWVLAALVPLALWGSARLFGLGPWGVVTATALGVGCFHYDSFAHWCNWVGMASWGAAAALVPLPVALLWRWLEQRRASLLVGLLASLAFVHALHPYSFFALVVPMLLLYVRARRSLGPVHHAALAAVILGTVLANLWWLVPSLRLWHYLLDSGVYLDARLDYLLTDYLGLLREPSVTGVLAMRTTLRFLALGGAAAGLWLWHKERDARFVPLAAALGVLLGVTYLGGYLVAVKQIQPYRFVLPATYLAVVPAAAFLERAVPALRASRPPAIVWALLALGLGLLLPRLARDIIYFTPSLVPVSKRPLPAPPPDINGGVLFGTIRWPAPFDYRLTRRPEPDYDALTDFVREHDDGSGRWLVEWAVAGERLAWATSAQVIGGFREINLAHADANLFRRRLDAAARSPEGLRSYFEQYAVHWVVLSNPVPMLESRPELLRREATFGPHRVYRVLEPSGLLAGDAAGRVTASLNRLSVRGSAGGSLVLRYHYLETLRCSPGCTLQREPVPGDRVGFIRVQGAPADFDVVNGY